MSLASQQPQRKRAWNFERDESLAACVASYAASERQTISTEKQRAVWTYENYAAACEIIHKELTWGAKHTMAESIAERTPAGVDEAAQVKLGTSLIDKAKDVTAKVRNSVAPIVHPIILPHKTTGWLPSGRVFVDDFEVELRKVYWEAEVLKPAQSKAEKNNNGTQQTTAPALPTWTSTWAADVAWHAWKYFGPFGTSAHAKKREYMPRGGAVSLDLPSVDLRSVDRPPLNRREQKKAARKEKEEKDIAADEKLVLSHMAVAAKMQMVSVFQRDTAASEWAQEMSALSSALSTVQDDGVRAALTAQLMDALKRRPSSSALTLQSREELEEDARRKVALSKKRARSSDAAAIEEEVEALGVSPVSPDSEAADIIVLENDLQKSVYYYLCFEGVDVFEALCEKVAKENSETLPDLTTHDIVTAIERLEQMEALERQDGKLIVKNADRVR